jgi:acyl transferase domain-containing protein
MYQVAANGVSLPHTLRAVCLRAASEEFIVMVGMSHVDYSELIQTSGDAPNAHAAVGQALGVASGRLAYFFGFNGQAVTYDTTCSSSLVALHHTLLTLQEATCDDAVCGGANLTLSPSTTALFAAGGLLATDGRCKVLDRRADGYTRAEAVVVLCVGAPAYDASDADTTYVIAAGGAVNQDGRSSALSAPSGLAQMLVMSAGVCAP